jgi:hypothetical protein
MLALHLLQNCMVYINTLMMQQVLARQVAQFWLSWATQLPSQQSCPTAQHWPPHGFVEAENAYYLTLRAPTRWEKLLG